MTKTIFIVIPARNEEHGIARVIDDLKQNMYTNIIVVSDGSTDATEQLAADAGAIVLPHLINRGQGAALRTGTDYALEHDADIIVHFDADGQMRATDIQPVIEPLLAEKADVSFGSRFMTTSSDIPPLRKILLHFGRIFMRLFFHVRTKDPQSGFRALTRHAAEQITITQRGMAHCSEILEQVHQKKLSFTEVPVTILYTDYSKKHGQNNLAALRIAAKLLWSKFIR